MIILRWNRNILFFNLEMIILLTAIVFKEKKKKNRKNMTIVAIINKRAFRTTPKQKNKNSTHNRDINLFFYPLLMLYFCGCLLGQLYFYNQTVEKIEKRATMMPGVFLMPRTKITG